jgi:yecA family protein
MGKVMTDRALGWEHLTDASPLTDAELDTLSAFLATLKNHDNPLSLSAVDGFFNALAISPKLVPIAEWMAWILGDVPAFSADIVHFPTLIPEQEAVYAASLLMRHYNCVHIAMRETSPPNYAPLFLYSEHSEQPWVSDWCHGFISGVHLHHDAWLDAIKYEADGAMLDLIYAMTVLAPPDFEYAPSDDDVGEDEVDRTSIAMRRMVHKALDDYRAQFDPIAGMDVLLELCVMHLRDHLLHPNQAVLCPCGSGNIFTNCCGTSDRKLH